ncbi:MAG: putative short-chain type dehydrogenase/reductase [Terrestrivirus sp.]|uniref:Putative short-chain type dehydrogenase/reductase n=1 Tax=Terrestrivirus sp. TaxID=2487775 RepID=A0A3G4ZNM2_9VIRU|nr:MAG: putative short-chain type dehydrogenase/reductase [Terrestrivirus sp.]
MNEHTKYLKYKNKYLQIKKQTGGTIPNVQTIIKSNRFNNRIAVIFGGTTGIGLETAIEFVKENISKVIVCGRTLEKWESSKEKISKELNTLADRIEYKQCDVRVYDQVDTVIKYIFETYGHLDICFNNAGVQPTSGGDITQETFESSIENDGSIIFKIPGKIQSCSYGHTPTSSHCENPIATSIIGIFNCLKAELTYIYRSQSKDLPVSIINTSSRNGILPSKDRPLYAGSKAFIISITKTVASQASQKSLEQERTWPIRINAIAPGPILTPLEIPIYMPNTNPFKQLTTEEFTEFNIKGSGGVPMGRTGLPWEISTVVSFLADEKTSSYITGTTIEVDGGYCSSPLFQKSVSNPKPPTNH